MTTNNIDAIRQRVNATEPAPWRVVEEHGRDIADEAYTRLTIQSGDNRESREIAEMVDPDHDWASKLPEENAEFIAHARTDVPVLLAKVDELTAERDAARDMANTARNETAQALHALDHARPVVDAAKTWRGWYAASPVRMQHLSDAEEALFAAVDALPTKPKPTTDDGGCRHCGYGCNDNLTVTP